MLTIGPYLFVTLFCIKGLKLNFTFIFALSYIRLGFLERLLFHQKSF